MFVCLSGHCAKNYCRRAACMRSRQYYERQVLQNSDLVRHLQHPPSPGSSSNRSPAQGSTEEQFRCEPPSSRSSKFASRALTARLSTPSVLTLGSLKPPKHVAHVLV